MNINDINYFKTLKTVVETLGMNESLSNDKQHIVKTILLGLSFRAVDKVYH